MEEEKWKKWNGGIQIIISHLPFGKMEQEKIENISFAFPIFHLGIWKNVRRKNGKCVFKNKRLQWEIMLGFNISFQGRQNTAQYGYGYGLFRSASFPDDSFQSFKTMQMLSLPMSCLCLGGTSSTHLLGLFLSHFHLNVTSACAIKVTSPSSSHSPLSSLKPSLSSNYPSTSISPIFLVSSFC